jgi:nucleotide sugar dehydrogenase
LSSAERVISIFGLGPLGLVTAVCYAKRGFQVIGIDPNKRRLRKIEDKDSPFFEPKLDEYLAETVDSGRFSVSDDPSLSISSDVSYIAVGTPCDKRGHINLLYVKRAALDIGHSLKVSSHNQLVIVKSTVTPGTARNLVKGTVERASGKKAGVDFGLCSNPEFLREGNAIEDTERPDRIIIGSDDPLAIDRLEAFYKEFHGEHTPQIIRTTHENAELIKYANNSFLATKISFINTIANIAEQIPFADVRGVAQAIGLDSRIAPAFLAAGLGYGGSCFPKDLDALITESKRRGYKPKLLEATKDVNEHQPMTVGKFAREKLGSLRGKKIAVLGLAFKAHTDDMRGAVSIPIIRHLLKMGAKISVSDPTAIPNAKEQFGHKIEYSLDPKECLKGADLAILVTECQEFKKLVPQDFVSLMKKPILFDGRRLYDHEEMTKSGVLYHGIGLGKGR